MSEDYHSILFVPSVYKMLTKVLTNKLQKVLSKIINQVQSVF